MRSHVLALGALVGFVVVSARVSARADEAQKSPRIVVVGVDKKTFDALGPWGGRYRPMHAKLIEQLDKAKVRAIAFDISFAENADFADATAAMARAAKASSAPVVIVGREGEPTAAVLRDAKVPEGHVAVGGTLDIKIDEKSKEIDVGSGPLALPADRGGLRPLGVELAVRAKVLSAAEADALAETVNIGFADGKAVTAKAYRPQSGDPAEVSTVSYVDVLQGKVDPKILEGALIIIGANDGEDDLYKEPTTRKKIPGVYLQAFTLKRLVDSAASAAKPTPAPARTKGLIGGLK
jgi:CHASE2 domain-containing sensor protein